MKKQTLLRKLAFSLIAVVFFLAILELTLRLTGFEAPVRKIEVVVDGRGEDAALSSEDDSMWIPQPSKGSFNRDGFIGPEISVARKLGVPRIAVIGDSCTERGDPPYSKLLQQKLEASLGRHVEVLNAGVIGYSTHQGVRRLEQDVLKYQPDIVTIYFGWNDHWLWQYMTDAELYGKQSLVSVRMRKALNKSRLVQGVNLVVEQLAHMAKGNEKPSRLFRVPLGEYKDNLRRMVRQIKQIGAIPVLVTAPTDMTAKTTKNEFEILSDLESTKYATPKELHDDYVAATREVAKEMNVVVIEAYEDFAGKSGLITKDHIHLTPAGIERMSTIFHERLLPLVEQIGAK